MHKPPFLQPYKGKATRHHCPACGTKQSFTLYLNGDTNQPISPKVGKCNRESKCGYHYTPKQFFLDNPNTKISSSFSSNTTNAVKPSSPSPLERVRGEVSFSYVQCSASYKSNFVRFLCEFMTDSQIHEIGENYALGATKNKEVIFWQIDINGKVRTGKIMQYNPETGRRIKHESGAIDWVHNKLKQAKQLPQNFDLQQCFFGEHLLKIYPDKTLAIVESEKSAVIAGAFFPDLVWLSAGSINGLSLEKCQILKGRNVILFPDLGAFEKWSEKAKEIQNTIQCKISISDILEKTATPEARESGYDIADYIIKQFTKPQSQIPHALQSKSRFTPLLQSMIDKNKSLETLIGKLQLVEIDK